MNESGSTNNDSGHKHFYDRDKEVTPELLMFFGRMEAKLDGALAWAKKHELESEHLEFRVSALERAVARIVGVAVGASVAVSAIATFVGYLVTNSGVRG